MLGQLKRFFEENIAPDTSGKGSEHGLHLATAALLVEVMQSDDEVEESERNAVVSAIRTKFDLSVAEADAIIELAHQELAESIDYHQFTSLINDAFGYEQRVRMVDLLWQVAYADGELDRYEEHTIRKIADLLHVRHSDFVASKHRASPH